MTIYLRRPLLAQSRQEGKKIDLNGVPTFIINGKHKIVGAQPMEVFSKFGRASMWVIDIRHWLNESQDGPAVPQLKKKVEKLKEIIVFASSVESLVPINHFPKCDKRPGRKPCKGRLDIKMVSDDEIYWLCPACGDEGVVSGWTDLFWNVTIDDFEGEIH